MEEEKCKNKAETIILWAGKILKGCKKHANAVNTLANVIGCSIEIRELPPNNDQCEFANDLENN